MVDNDRVHYAYFVDRESPEYKASTLLVANPINRYPINSPMLPRYEVRGA